MKSKPAKLYKKDLVELIARIFAYKIDKKIIISGLCFDHRNIKPGDCFVALSGARFNAENFIAAAINSGAVAVLKQADKTEVYEHNNTGVLVFGFPKIESKLGEFAALFYDNPTLEQNIIGITGTNGKSSMSYLLAAALTNKAEKAAFLGTIGFGGIDNYAQTERTTEPALEIQRKLALLHEQDYKNIAMEVSSHGIVQGRVNNINFNSFIFTNISPDHLDYHGTLSAYAAAKLSIFSRPEIKNIITNFDDTYGRKLLTTYKDQKQVVCYGFDATMKDHADFYVQAKEAQTSLTKTHVSIATSWGDIDLVSDLIGPLNIYNIMNVAALILASGYPLNELPDIVANLPQIPGRMELFTAPKLPIIIVDYAHNGEALAQILQFLKSHTKGSLCCVFGCGGERPVQRRVGMGKAAAAYADKIVLTADNPRGESLDNINRDISENIVAKEKLRFISDRKEAITSTIIACKPDDVVLVSGKGHERYQEIQGIKYDHSDIDVINGIFNSN